MITWRDDLPRWEQIVRVIGQRIDSGQYPPGHRITERDLIEEFVVAKVTARKAMAAMREAGLVYTRPNLGSFVGPDPDIQDR